MTEVIVKFEILKPSQFARWLLEGRCRQERDVQCMPGGEVAKYWMVRQLPVRARRKKAC
jgi:hypothetical protein